MLVSIDSNNAIGCHKELFDAEFETNTHDGCDSIGPAQLCVLCYARRLISGFNIQQTHTRYEGIAKTNNPV